MRLIELMAWCLLGALLTVLVIGWAVRTFADVAKPPPATRYEVIDGQRVPFWATQHRGEPIRIYVCPGQEPQIAGAHADIECEGKQ